MTHIYLNFKTKTIIKLDNLNNSISFTGENNKDPHYFDKEITKNPYI